MHALSSPPSYGWSFGGSILTFAFPMILFIVVAATLYVLYTKPEMVPGHPVQGERPVSYTPVPHSPEGAPTQAVAAQPAAPDQVVTARADAARADAARADAAPAGEGEPAGTTGTGASGHETGEVAGTEDAE